MLNPPMKTSDFDFHLPEELVARHPAERRDASRLLVIDRRRDSVAHKRFSDLPHLLDAGDLLVVNDSRVIPARLMARREGTGGKVEIFLLEEKGPSLWLAMVRPGKKVMPGDRLIVSPRELEAEVIAFEGQGERILRFESSVDFDSALQRHGHTPLPPYILKARKQQESGPETELEQPGDRERYQTVYARQGSSVAAPTAGLHFTPELLGECEDKGIALARVELDVGAGTFLPVKTEDPSAHPMHYERYRLGQAAVDQILQTKAAGGRVVAVGTTVVRVLESAAAMPDDLHACDGSTNLFIMPGFQYKVIDALVTNFHLPRSTLLMLVAAFAGRERVLAAYAEAIEHGYRFYSYGDAMLIL